MSGRLTCDRCGQRWRYYLMRRVQGHGDLCPACQKRVGYSETTLLEDVAAWWRDRQERKQQRKP